MTPFFVSTSIFFFFEKYDTDLQVQKIRKRKHLLHHVSFIYTRVKIIQIAVHKYETLNAVAFDTVKFTHSE